MTSAEIAFAIFIAKHNLPMAVGDEFGLLAKKMSGTTVPVAPPGGGKNTNYRFSRFFVRSVPLFRSLMLTPMRMLIFLAIPLRIVTYDTKILGDYRLATKVNTQTMTNEQNRVNKYQLGYILLKLSG